MKQQVAFLRPSDTTWDAFFTDYERTLRGKEPVRFNESLNEAIDDCFELLRTQAEALGIDLDIQELDLRSARRQAVSTHHSALMGRAENKTVRESQIICTVDPPAQVMGYIMESVLNNPVLRGIIGFRKHETFERMMGMTQHASTTLFAAGKLEKISKVYPVSFQEQRPETTEQPIQNAMLFPHGKSRPLRAQSGTIIQPTEDEIEMDLGWRNP